MCAGVIPDGKIPVIKVIECTCQYRAVTEEPLKIVTDIITPMFGGGSSAAPVVNGMAATVNTAFSSALSCREDEEQIKRTYAVAGQKPVGSGAASGKHQAVS